MIRVCGGEHSDSSHLVESVRTEGSPVLGHGTPALGFPGCPETVGMHQSLALFKARLGEAWSKRV